MTLDRIEVVIGILVPVITSLITIYSVIKSQNIRTAEKEVQDRARDVKMEEQLKTLFNLIKKLEMKQDENNHVKIRTAELETWTKQHEKQHASWEKQIESRISNLESK